MIEIKKATRADLPAVAYLLQQSGKMIIEDAHFNKRDIALQARDEDGQLVGFLWCGLMCNGKLGYIDKFAVSREYTKKGIGNLLAISLLAECVKRGVRRVIGTIKQDGFHDASAMNALKLAMAADKIPHTFVYADVQNSLQELRSLEVNNGRQ